MGAREKVTPGRDRSDPRASSTRRPGCAGRPTPAAARGAGAAPEPDPPLRLRGKRSAGGHRSAPHTPLSPLLPKVAAMPRKSLGPGPGPGLWGGPRGVAVCGLLCPSAERRGWRRGGARHKGLGAHGAGGGCPRGLVLAAGGPSPPGPAPILLPRGALRPGPPRTLVPVPARAPCRADDFLKPRSARLGFRGAHRTGLAPKSEKRGAGGREKSLTGRMCVLGRPPHGSHARRAGGGPEAGPRSP